MPNEFFVDPTGTGEVAPSFGHTWRSCARCSSPWGPARCSDASCTSVEFRDRYVGPTPFLTGIKEKLGIKPTEAPRATPEQLAALEHLRNSAQDLLAEMVRVDELLRDAVRGDVQSLIPAQGILARASGMIGDANIEHVDGLTLRVRALALVLEEAIAIIHTEHPK